MRELLRRLASSAALAAAVFVAWQAGCGGSSPPSGFSTGGDGGGTATGSSSGSASASSGGRAGDSSIISFGGDGAVSSSSEASAEGGVPCPAGLMCNVACSAGATTTISGTVYDPAARNPLYDVAVYVPATPLQPLPQGVPTGADACSCAALFKSGAVVSATTQEDGTFTLNNAPAGSSVPLVIQIGKWRRQFTIDVKPCEKNQVPDKMLLLPSSVAAGDTVDSMPQIAVSTGSADTLECLLTRIGLPPTEYVAGPGGAGHVHIFTGGSDVGGTDGLAGQPETPAMPGAPASPSALWANAGELMPFDIVMLSCEGGETYNANPPALEQYLNAGGRVFASHYHYAWFSGPMEAAQTFTVPPDWGTNLATWTQNGGSGNGPIGGIIDTMLNGSTKAFPKGVSLQKWLGNVNALGQNGVAAGELSIFDPRYDAQVVVANGGSQPWITSDSTGQAGYTMYFSFDTPTNAPTPADGGAPQYCGRVVYSDLHVGSDPSTGDSSPPPDGCYSGALSPQEKALEFMLFDLSSCVIPDTIAPPSGFGAQ
jgi:hypothetical protein